MSAALLSTLLLLSIVLMVESCMKIHDGVHTTHGFPVSGGSSQHPDTGNTGKSSGPVPPHPFRKRSVDDLDATKLKEFMTVKIQELFNDLDSDSDGYVTVTEWTRRKAGVTEFSRLLTNFNTNGDDTLSLEEFVSAVTMTTHS